MLRPHYILKRLDNCLSTIKDEERLGVFMDHILNPSSFWQGYCEIEVASILKENFGAVELEPTLLTS